VNMSSRNEQSLLISKPCTPCRPANLHACKTCAWSGIHSTSVQQQEKHRCQSNLLQQKLESQNRTQSHVHAQVTADLLAWYHM
jgi:hypothetical protein